MPERTPGLLWDVFCHVIDNWGDVGVCWRLASGLAQAGQRVRLWLDDDHALAWMAPQGHPGVTVLPWSAAQQAATLHGLPAADVWIEAFGCALPDAFVAHFAPALRLRPHTATGAHPWLNLEYLSAEAFVVRLHGLTSPVGYGPGAGLNKTFFYPGFTPATGGLLREPDLLNRQAHFAPRAWLRRHGLPDDEVRRVSLFCYDPPALPHLLQALVDDGVPTRLLVTAGRAQQAVARLALATGWAGWPQAAGPGFDGQIGLQRSNGLRGVLHISYLPALSQLDFDALLWACDLNLVRGEDSMVRALWAGRALIWQLYAQDDGAHATKLDAWLNWLDADPALRAWHAAWNGLANQAIPPAGLALPCANWCAGVQRARARLLAGPDLVSQLLAHVGPTRASLRQ